MNDVSVVVANWNSGLLLEKCLLSLRACSPDAEVVVVDNNSADESVERAVDACPSVQFIRNAANRGFAAACNSGWRRSGGSLVLFLNPDAECTPGGIEALAGLFHADGAVWGAGGCLVNPDGSPQAGFNVRSFPTLGSTAAEILLVDEIWPSNPWTRAYRSKRSLPREVAEVDQPAGACLMVRRSVLERMQGFDEGFQPAWFEDVDLCRRIRAAGGRILFHPGARFLHHGGTSLAHLSPERFLVMFHTNQVRYFRKHHGLRSARRVRRLVVQGMRLRAAISLAVPLMPGRSRAACFASFCGIAGHFARLPMELP